MNFLKKIAGKKWFSYSVATCSAVVLYLILTHLNVFFGFLGNIYQYILPVITGVCIAVILSPMMNLFETKVFSCIKNKKIVKGLAIGLTTLVVILIMVILLAMLIPQLVDSVMTLIGNWNSYAGSLMDLMNQISILAEEYDLDFSKLNEIGDNTLNVLTRYVPQNLDTIVNTSFSIGKGFFNAIISYILAVYFLVDKERLIEGISRFHRAILPGKIYKRISEFITKCYDILIRYIGGSLLDALIVTVSNFIFMTLTGMPYQLLISVVVGVTNLAPTFGPILGCVIGAFILFLVNPWYTLWFIIFTLILQTIDGYVIKPKLFGDSFGIPAVWILVMIIVGGRIFGFWGIMLAIPTTAILSYFFETFIKNRIENKEEAVEANSQEEIKNEKK